MTPNSSDILPQVYLHPHLVRWCQTWRQYNREHKPSQHRCFAASSKNPSPTPQLLLYLIYLGRGSTVEVDRERPLRPWRVCTTLTLERTWSISSPRSATEKEGLNTTMLNTCRRTKQQEQSRKLPPKQVLAWETGDHVTPCQTETGSWGRRWKIPVTCARKSTHHLVSPCNFHRWNRPLHLHTATTCTIVLQAGLELKVGIDLVLPFSQSFFHNILAVDNLQAQVHVCVFHLDVTIL